MLSGCDFVLLTQIARSCLFCCTLWGFCWSEKGAIEITFGVSAVRSFSELRAPGYVRVGFSRAVRRRLVVVSTSRAIGYIRRRPAKVGDLIIAKSTMEWTVCDLTMSE